MKRIVSILLNTAFCLVGSNVLAQQAEAPPPAGPPEAAQPLAPASEPAAPADLPPPPPPKPAEAPTAETEETPPPIVVATPAPEPPVVRTYHHHDGFYLRLSAGLSVARANLATDSTASPDFNAVKQKQRLVALAAAHVEASRKAAARHTRQVVGGPDRIVAEARQALELAPVELLRGRRSRTRERVSACGHDDVLERWRGRRERRVVPDLLRQLRWYDYLTRIRVVDRCAVRLRSY